ncbi:DUF342 domain-containing protein [Salibacterium aidingense]|uniref:DUF342 domain-containing protein n=1 Tax=Salibacterium aidingense TaxID=384933 RepID=UPI000424164A|nr:FapA family protein [Salibacterium aidingense]
MEENIRDYFKVKVSEDKLSAQVIAMAPPEDAVWSYTEWEAFLKDEGVTFGLIEKNITRISQDPQSVVYPLEIAKGTPPGHGASAYIRPADFYSEKQQGETENIDLKNVIDIPMVEAGDFTGEKVEAEPGKNGTAVDGEELKGKDGLDFVLRPGKNTRLEGNAVYAVESGQVSVQKKTIHVYPLYEVNGDIDLKTGNIDFTGNITVRGNVPSGFELKSKGDIRVFGTVEAAFLEAQGSIYISAGVTAQQKGSIKAGQDIHATYLNEANVSAGANVHVKQAVMHSYCQAGDSVYCDGSKGQVVGGMISAVNHIKVKEAGNTMNTPTSFYIGIPHDQVKRQKALESALLEAKEESGKVTSLLRALEQKEKEGDGLSSKERVMKLRAKNTLDASKHKARDAAEDLQEMLHVSQNVDSGTITVEKKLHSNVDIHFGKYRRKINTAYEKATISFQQGEIDLSVV